MLRQSFSNDMKKLFYSLLVISSLFVSACHKDKKTDNGTDTGPSKTGTTLDLIRDSVFLYAQEDYLWYSSLPTYADFQPRSSKYNGADDKTTLDNLVNAISQKAINPLTHQPYEYYSRSPGEAKYSFIDNGQVSAELNGTKGDFGFAPFYNPKDYTDLRVKYVYPGSLADLQGM